MKELRKHQLEACKEIKALQKRFPISYLSLPTGAGKTITALELLKVSPDRFHFWLSHRKELCRQAEKEADEQIKDHKIIVMTWQAAKNAKHLQHFRAETLIVDEIHWGGTLTSIDGKLKSIAKAIDAIKPERIIFLTATPDRIDERTLGPIVKQTCVKRSMTEGIKNGYLSPVNIIALPPCNNSTQTIDAMSSRMKNLKNCLFVLPSIAEAESALKHFQEKYPQLPACSLHSRTKGNPLRIAEIRAGTFNFVFSVGMCDTGFDWPALENIVLINANLTNHRRIKQVLGRVARLSQNKTEGTFFYSESKTSYKKDINIKIGSTKNASSVSLQDWLIAEIEGAIGRLNEEQMRCIILSILLNAQESLDGFTLPKIRKEGEEIITSFSDEGKKYTLEKIFHKKKKLSLSVIEEIKQKALNGERKPLQKSPLGKQLRTLLHVKSNGNLQYPEFRKWILQNAPHWLLEKSHDIAAARKRTIKKILTSGGTIERPSLLWKSFRVYVKSDKDFREFIETTRPELLEQLRENHYTSEKAEAKKRQIIAYANAGFTTKQLKEKGLMKRFIAYTSPKRKEFDPTFTKEVYRIAPAWIPQRAAILRLMGII